MRLLLFVGFIFRICLLIGQSPQFRHYTVNNGLANSMVYYVMQDSKGYMWFCTESGVNRFDGNHFELFTIKDGLADNENFKSFEDSKGRIWFSSYNGKLSYFDGEKIINENLDPALKYNTTEHRYISNLVEDKQGNIWFSKYCSEVVYKFDGKKIQEIPTKPLLSDNHSFPSYYILFFNQKNGPNYFRFNYEGLLVENFSDNKSKKIVCQAADHKEGLCRPFLQYTENGEFYFLTNMGLRHFRNDSVFFELSAMDIGITVPESLISFKIENENLWLATSRKGLIFIRDFMKKGFTGNYQTFLPGSTISHVTSDNEGGIWATSLSDGIYYLPRSANYITNIPEESLTAIEHSPYHDVFATGDFYGALKVFSKNSVVHRFKFDSVEGTRIKQIKWLTNNKLFLGTDYTTYFYDLDKKRKPVPILGSGWYSGFSDLDEGPAGIWLEGRTQIYLLNGDKRDIIYESVDPSSNKLFSIAEGGTKGCWFTSIKNLYWLTLATKKTELIAGQEIFNSNLKDVRHVNGDLWVATDGNGIFVFRDRKLIRHINSKNTQMSSDICQKLVYDGKENLWVATNKGITVLSRRSFKHVMSLSTNDILINDDIKDIDLHDKSAYVATPAGISIIDVEKFVRVTDPPKIYLKSFLVNDSNYSDSEFPKFYYFNGVIKLGYTAITFQARQSLQYRYKMSGKENSWNETRSEQLEFYNLNPGTYELLISAKKYNSDWCQPLKINFTVLPLWYQSAWFKISVACFLIIFIYLVVIRILRTTRKKNETERKVLETELRAIRLHMNPHFIFNTLNSLQLFIFQNKSLEANDYVAKFSRLMRWIMIYSEKQEITLREELEFLNTYVELEQLRFEKGFIHTLVVDAKLNPDSVYIPPLIIQPFVENAIKYGLAGKEENGSLQISFEKKGGLILVVVEDNGVGRKRVKEEQMASNKRIKSTGIKYTEERLKILFKGVKVKLPVKVIDLLDNGNASGTRVELIIPILI